MQVNFFALLPSREICVSRSPRARLCSPKLRKKNYACSASYCVGGRMAAHGDCRAVVACHTCCQPKVENSQVIWSFNSK